MINKDMIQDVYSTEEVKTNKVWINGKPIYRKVIYLDTITFLSGKATTVPTNISNLDEIIFVDFLYRYSNGRWYKNWDMLNKNNITVNETDFNVIISTENTKFYKFHLILEYTKTTD